MNYMAEIKAFYDLVQVKQLSTGQIALWHALMHINNKCAWIEWFTVPNLTLELHTGLSRKGIYNARNTLKQYGIIDFKNNGTKATSYKMISLLNNTQVSTQRNTQDKSTLQHFTQDTTQGTTQDTTQATTQDSATLNKLDETKQDEDDDVINDNDPFVYYSKNIGPMLPYIADLIKQYQNDLPDELITEAFKIAVRNNARSMRYAEKIMLSWLDKEIRTMEDYKRHEAEREHRKAAEAGREEAPAKRQYTQAEIEAAARYIKKAVSRYDGDDVIGYIRSLGYPEEISESAIALLIERKELAI